MRRPPESEIMPDPNLSLHRAINKGDVKGISTALKAGADKNRYAHELVVQALGDFIEYEDPDMLIMLHEQGVNMNAVFPMDGRTALHKLIDEAFYYFGQEEFYKVLKQVGFDWNIQDMGGNTPVHMAANHAEPFDLEQIKSMGGDLNKPNSAGRTIAFQLVGNTSNLQDYVDVGVNFNVIDRNKNTPLHGYHDSSGSDDMDDTLRVLHAVGVNLHAKNMYQMTASDFWAAKFRDQGSTELLDAIVKYQPLPLTS